MQVDDVRNRNRKRHLQVFPLHGHGRAIRFAIGELVREPFVVLSLRRLRFHPQRVFGWILTRAAAAKDEDAARYGMDVGADVPVSKLMADAVGVGEAGASDVAGFALPDRIGPVTVWTFRW